MAGSASGRAPSERATMIRRLALLSERHSWMRVGLLLVILSAIFAALNPYFLSIDNISGILQAVSIMLIVATGMTLVLVGGGIDLSVGSTAVLSSTILAVLLRDHGLAAAPISLAIALLSGLGVGLINGLVIGVLGVNPLIMTLGMMMAVRSAAELVSFGIVSGLPPEFGAFFNARIAGFVPPYVLIALGVAVLGAVLLQNTVFGANLRGVGANPKSAAYIGIPVRRYRIIVYALNGVLAALAGIVLVGRTNAATTGALVGFELYVIAGIIIGGTSFLGGRGTVVGTVVGILMMGVINNGMNLAHIDPFWQQVVQGAIILVAVFFDARRSAR
jgi:ribose transport system permease protein